MASERLVMRDLAFWVPIDQVGVDLSAPNCGNPGIGGTWFVFSLIWFNLLDLFSHKYRIFVLSPVEIRLPEGCVLITLKDFDDACRWSCDHKTLLISRTEMASSYFDTISRYPSVKVVTWSHNYFNSRVAKRICSSGNIAANVFVGKQQYDFYCDHDVIQKSVYIYNVVPSMTEMGNRKKHAPTVVYVGNFSRDKGVVEMLKIWDRIQLRIPDAELKIIGGAMYGEKDGEINGIRMPSDLASKVSKYLIDDNGAPKKNIHLLGVLGPEKYDVFQESSVGVVNPTAKTETFGMSIIEMGSVGLPVVTKSWNGHLDTVISGETGVLCITERGIGTWIVRLLRDPILLRRFGEEARSFSKRFRPEEIIPQWDSLFDKVFCEHQTFPRIEVSCPLWNNYKFIRRWNAFVRFDCGLELLPAVVDIETLANELKKKVLFVAQGISRYLRMSL